MNATFDRKPMWLFSIGTKRLKLVAALAWQLCDAPFWDAVKKGNYNNLIRYILINVSAICQPISSAFFELAVLATKHDLHVWDIIILKTEVTVKYTTKVFGLCDGFVSWHGIRHDKLFKNCSRWGLKLFWAWCRFDVGSCSVAYD